jgi:hypothetical protein
MYEKRLALGIKKKRKKKRKENPLYMVPSDVHHLLKIFNYF